jgi:mannose-1-phosphate guanylyltransferase
MRRVLTFVEKPPPETAESLAQRGGLWNTMVMVCRPKAMLDLVARVAPTLRSAFERVRLAIDTPQETRVVEEVYRDLEPVNFSRTVIEAIPGRRSPSLLVLPVRGVSWSDWGSEQRILNTLDRTRREGHYAGSRPSPVTLPVPDLI